jgi:uncharacterized protein YoxC
MKRGMKVFLIILGIAIILIVAYASLTLYQLSKIAKLAQDKSFEEELRKDIETLTNGNCSKLPSLKEKVLKIDYTLKYACINPVIKYFISKNSQSGKDFCTEFEDPESEFMTFLKNAETICRGR